MSEINPTSNTPQDESQPTSSEGAPTVRLTNVEPSQAEESRWSEIGQDWREVGEEFKKLGVRLGSAIRAGAKPDQEQQISGLGDQLRAMADQVEAAVRAARQEAQSPETRAQTQRVVAAAKGAQATLVDDVRDAVSVALRALNAQLKELADRLESGRKER
jgi:hypothetical protein